MHIIRFGEWDRQRTTMEWQAAATMEWQAAATMDWQAAATMEWQAAATMKWQVAGVHLSFCYIFCLLHFL